MHIMPTTKRSAGGNILFVILIAIGLFALLGSVVMDGETATNQISKDKAKLAAQEILAYAQTVERGVQRMLTNGISENDLCFDYDEYPGGNSDYEHAACATESNRVFHPAGGGVRYKAPDPKYFDPSYSSEPHYQTYLFSGYTDVVDLPLGTGDSGQSELILFVPSIKRAICIAFNDMIDLPWPKGSEPPYEDGYAFSGAANAFFTGSFTNVGTQISGGGVPAAVPELWGSRTKGCLKQEATDSYAIYYVLHVRY